MINQPVDKAKALEKQLVLVKIQRPASALAWLKYLGHVPTKVEAYSEASGSSWMWMKKIIIFCEFSVMSKRQKYNVVLKSNVITVMMILDIKSQKHCDRIQRFLKPPWRPVDAFLPENVLSSTCTYHDLAIPGNIADLLSTGKVLNDETVTVMHVRTFAQLSHASFGLT